jgi:hypothetical protein
MSVNAGATYLDEMGYGDILSLDQGAKDEDFSGC